MSEQVAFSLRNRNPDVLTCIANLSNDEVFTPPAFANQMLDCIADAWSDTHNGANIWADSTVRFLDPFTKSGVFLREITARLVAGLVEEIPALQMRVDHILANQVFGIGITRLTALIARRSVYCSKLANGKHSVATQLNSEDGNVWFETTAHTWVGASDFIESADSNGEPIRKGVNGRCKYCGASQGNLDRGPGLETHAYAFIHTDDISARLADIFGETMQFDVIIGNPPYQLSDGGQGASAVPIYNKFVDQAKALEPRILSMVIPARWYFGGRGLDSFRRSMLEDRRIRKLVDFPDSRRAFDSVDVAGGICYFLWDRDAAGDCEVVTHDPNGMASTTFRPLLEPGADIFVRSNEALQILRKVVMVESGEDGIGLPAGRRFDQQVSGQRPFGLRTYYRGSETPTDESDVLVQQAGGQAWAKRDAIEDGLDLIDKWKVFTSKSSSEHAGQADKNGMRRVLSLSGLLPPGSVVTETYVLLGAFDSEAEARNCLSYACTRFFRFMVATRASAQDLPRSAYSFVPVQDFSVRWSDGTLYSKYQLSEDEIELIESTIRPMDVPDE